MTHRPTIILLNFLFPPLAVAILTGLGSPETILNILLFVLAIVPSYIHGFYVTWRYFHRQEITERYQWDGVEKHRRRSSSSSTRVGRSSKRVSYGEVEEYSDDDDYYELPAGHRRTHGRNQQRHQYSPRRISDIPPAVPEPPLHSKHQRYLH